MKWGLHKSVTLYKKNLAGQCVVYQLESGDTHLFTNEALVILTIMNDGSTYSESELLEKFYQTVEAPDIVPKEQMKGLLLSLERYGILERNLP